VNLIATLNWEHELKKTKNQTCIDCLHCKVLAKSTEKQRLCFCEMAENAKNHKKLYWFGKKVCNAFESMGTFITLHTSGRPLLKDAGFLDGISWGRGNYA
jgi:hypothetical protein